MKVKQIIPLDQRYAPGQEVVETEDGVSHTCTIGGYHVGDEYPKGDKALRYNEGKLQWHLLDIPFVEGIIKVLMFGKERYGEGNWKKPMDRNTILDSQSRHQSALMKGEEIDPDSGLPHVHHLACNAMLYSYHYVKR